MYREQTTRLANTVAVADPQGGSSEGVHYCNLTVQRDTMQSASTLHQQVGAALADAHSMHEKVGGWQHPPAARARYARSRLAAPSCCTLWGWAAGCSLHMVPPRHVELSHEPARVQAGKSPARSRRNGDGRQQQVHRWRLLPYPNSCVNKLVVEFQRQSAVLQRDCHPQTQNPPSCALLREHVANNGSTWRTTAVSWASVRTALIRPPKEKLHCVW